MAQIKIDKNTKLGRGATATIYKANFDGVLYAAKVYNDKNRFNKAKIEAMLSNPPANILIKFADEVFPQLAWPQKIFRLDNGETHGYLMPIIDLDESFPLDYFYDPVLFNKLNAPEESALSYKVEIARNLASIIADLHRHGHFFIDLKPQNIRVFRHTHVVTLLDCDGFSIACKTNKRFPADLISSDYISPEAYKNRTSPEQLGVEQDLYALAVILFQILNNGTHPFQGIIQDDNIDAPTNDEKAALALYPHGIENNKRILPRPQSIHELWPTSTRKLFDSAFVGDPKKRPTASEWAEHFDQLLKDKLLVRCEKHPLNIAHIKFKLKECPRCYLDNLAKKPRTAKSTDTSQNKTYTQQPQAQYTQSTTKIYHSHPKTEDISWFKYLFFVIVLIMGVRLYSKDEPKKDTYSQAKPEVSRKETPKQPQSTAQPPVNIPANDYLSSYPSEAAQATVNLGWYQMDPNRTGSKDYKKAYDLNYEGYILGHGEGASNIGLLYENGLGRQVNLYEAEYWYGTAIRHKIHSAQAEIGILHLYLVHNFKAFDSNKIDALFKQAQNQLLINTWVSNRSSYETELAKLRTIYKKQEKLRQKTQKQQQSTTQPQVNVSSNNSSNLTTKQTLKEVGREDLIKSKISKLSSEEYESLTSACSQSRFSGQNSYDLCILNHLKNLGEQSTNVSLAPLTEDQKKKIEMNCSEDKFINGPSAYKKCISTQIKQFNIN
jgi:serine/threonine protein kinase